MQENIKIKKHYKNKYTTIDNLLINDMSISFKAKGMFLYFWSKPDDWQVKPKAIDDDWIDKKHTVYSGLKELEENGYLKRNRYYVNGRIAGINYHFSDTKEFDQDFLNQENLNPENQDEYIYIQKKEITKERNNKSKEITKDTKVFFQKPSLDEVIEYSLLKGEDEKLATEYFNYYDSRDWKDSNDRAVKNWKLKFDKQWLKPKNALSVKSINSTFKKILDDDMRFYDEEKELIESLLLHFKGLRKPPTTQNVIWILDALNELKSELPIKEIVDKIIQNNWKSLNRDYFVGEIQKNQEQNKEKKIYDFNAIKEYTKGW